MYFVMNHLLIILMKGKISTMPKIKTKIHLRQDTTVDWSDPNMNHLSYGSFDPIAHSAEYHQFNFYELINAIDENNLTREQKEILYKILGGIVSEKKIRILYGRKSLKGVPSLIKFDK